MKSSYSMEEMLPIVAELSFKYTSGESTSVTYDKAMQLMGAVQYVIFIYEIEMNSKESLSTSEKLPAKTAYEKGYELLIEKVKMVQEEYNQLISHFVSFENENYEDTVVRGIPAFFLYYDPKFAPADTIITMDYPVPGRAKYKQGILAIEEYLIKIKLEQVFFQGLSTDYIYQVLEGQPDDYKEQFYNICSLVLKDILVQMMGGKEKNCLENEMRQRLKQYLHILVQEKYDGNEQLESYFSLNIEDYIVDFFLRKVDT